ncbi:unnamed protein product, partial [Amoebophrya sp. A25]
VKRLIEEEKETSKKLREIRQHRSELTTAVAAREEALRPKKMQPLYVEGV